MEEQIKKLQLQLEELKKVYRNDQKIKYENQPHKHFENGDIVTNGDKIVVVEWTENIANGMPYEKGYMGGSIINGNRGFCCFKRDEFDLVADSYYKTKHRVEIYLTGLEIEEIKYSLGWRNCNPNASKAKLLDYLDGLHKSQ